MMRGVAFILTTGCYEGPVVGDMKGRSGSMDRTLDGSKSRLRTTWDEVTAEKRRGETRVWLSWLGFSAVATRDL